MKFTNNNKTSWESNGKKVTIKLQNIQNALFFNLSNVIGYLVGKELHNPDRLLVYSLDGQLLYQIERPEGYQFEYLVSHPNADVVVVCGIIDIENSNELWSDFYFGLDLSSGVFSKIGIAR